MNQGRHDEDHQRRLLLGNRTTALVNHSLQNGGMQGPFPPHYNQQQHGYYYDGYYYPYPPEETKFIGIIPWMIKILRLFVIGILLLSSSLVMYGTFYWAVMPGSYASRSLFFDYTGTVPYPHQNATLNRPTPAASCEHDNAEVATTTSSTPVSTTTEPNAPIYYAHTPWASVDLFAVEEAVSWSETLHAELIPLPTIQDRILQPQQPYYVEVHLTLPESPLNRQIGMFGVAVELFSHPDENGTTLKLASSVRPARLPHESVWLEVIRKIVWIVPLMFGGMQESRVIVIPSFRHVVESTDYPLRYVVTRLVGQASLMQQRYGHVVGQVPEQNSRPPVEVSTAEVRIGKELNQLQQILKDWFYTCYAIGTMVFFGLHIAAWVILQYYFGPQEDFGDPYFDPSCDFDNGQRQDDGFESIRSNEHDDNDLDDDDQGGPAEGEEEKREGEEHDSFYDTDENSQEWEACPPVSSSQEEESDEITDNRIPDARETIYTNNHSGETSRFEEAARVDVSPDSEQQQRYRVDRSQERLPFAAARQHESGVRSSVARKRRKAKEMAESKTGIYVDDRNDDQLRKRQIDTDDRKKDDERVPRANAVHDAGSVADGGRDDDFFDCEEIRSVPSFMAQEQCLGQATVGNPTDDLSGDSYQQKASSTSKDVSPKESLEFGDERPSISLGGQATCVVTGSTSTGTASLESSPADVKDYSSDHIDNKVSKDVQAGREDGQHSEPSGSEMNEPSSNIIGRDEDGQKTQDPVPQRQQKPAVLQLPEAQVLDSFLHDLINPFVR